MLIVYIAGKYSDDNVISTLNNIKEGIKLGAELMQRGFAPFCPFLDFNFQFFADLTIEQYKAYSMRFVEASDAVLLLPSWERSNGARAEIERALELKIPVFTKIDALENWRCMKEIQSGIKQVNWGRVAQRVPR